MENVIDMLFCNGDKCKSGFVTPKMAAGDHFQNKIMKGIVKYAKES